MTIYKASTAVDVYKLGHRKMYPPGTEYVYSNITARDSRIFGVSEIVVFGVQGAVKEIVQLWEDTFL